MNPTITATAAGDADLVLAARRHEPGAYGELFRRWYDRCYDVALNIVRDRETAADVAQDAFLVGWERLMDLRDPEAFGGWILRTARNRALNRVTRDRHRSMEPIEPYEGAMPPDLDADPALQAERSAQRQLIWTAMAALGERDSSLLDLHLRHGLEPAEIAEELRITPNNASQLLFRLRRKLREAIGAVLLWRDGKPTCETLARLLAKADAFDPQVAGTIRRHQRDCDRCLRELSAQTNPERLFASVPLAIAPLIFKERAAQALVQAGVPLFAPTAPVAPAAAGAPAGPPQGAGRLVTAVAAGLVGLGVVTAVLLWPSGNGPDSVAAGRRPPAVSPSASPTVAASSATGAPLPTPAGATTPVNIVPLSNNTDPVVQRSHAPRRSTGSGTARRTTPPATSPAVTTVRTPTSPAGGAGGPTNPGGGWPTYPGGGWPTYPGGGWPTYPGGGWPPDPGSGGHCHHPHGHPDEGWSWPWSWCTPHPCPWAAWTNGCCG